MRTHIVMDDQRRRDARQASGLPAQRATVEEALRRLVQVKRQTSLRRWRGRIQWDGKLAEMRASRSRTALSLRE